jgi:hypothetical protein
MPGWPKHHLRKDPGRRVNLILILVLVKSSNDPQLPAPHSFLSLVDGTPCAANRKVTSQPQNNHPG